MRVRWLVLAVVLGSLAPCALVGQKNCRKGKPCGNTCIAVDVES